MFYTYLYATGAAFFIFLEVYVKRRRSHQEVANRSPSGSADAPLDPISPTSSNSLPLTITTYQSSSDQNSDNVAGQLPSATGNANQPEFDEQRNRSSSFISEQFSPPVDVYIIHHKEQALPHQTSLYLRIAAISEFTPYTCCLVPVSHYTLFILVMHQHRSPLVHKIAIRIHFIKSKPVP